MTSSDTTNPCSGICHAGVDATIPAEFEPPKEQLPAVILIVRYILICVPFAAPPKALHAYNDEDMCRMVRDLYMHNDQQYLFVIRNGELGKLYKTTRGLAIRFKEAGVRLKIPIFDRYKPAPDGWLGD